MTERGKKLIEQLLGRSLSNDELEAFGYQNDDGDVIDKALEKLHRHLPAKTSPDWGSA